ncbi:MAG: mandelate racemase/muconate lactonizing enzyme family protein [Spirochaetia bacterium]
MRIREIRSDRVSIASSIRNSYIDFSEMDVAVVSVVTDVVHNGKPVIGYGFNSNGRYAPTSLIRERFAPRVLRADPATLVDDRHGNLDPFALWRSMMANEKPGGHGERSVAVGTIDMAVWDAVAKIENKPLHRLLAERFGGDTRPTETPFVYAAGGYYYEGKDIEQLQAELGRYLAAGYNLVKMKIGGASLSHDMNRIAAAIETVGDASRLAVDANGRFDLKQALSYARALEPLGLAWFEEAGDPLDYALQAEVSAVYTNPMATGENLFSHQDVRNLLRYAGLTPSRDILQMDPVLSYGLVEYLRMLDVLENMGWSRRRCIPHGGHQFALHIVSGLGLGGNESYPEVFAPFGGFPDGIAVSNGEVRLPERPGIGFEGKSDLMDVFRTSGLTEK